MPVYYIYITPRSHSQYRSLPLLANGIHFHLLGAGDVFGDHHRVIHAHHCGRLQEEVQVIIGGHHPHGSTTQHIGGPDQDRIAWKVKLAEVDKHENLHYTI